MKLPISWLKDYIDIDLPLDELAYKLTMLGLEVEEIQLVGLPVPTGAHAREFKFTGLAWPVDKFVVAQIDEVMPHPNADRLVLCRLNDGTGELTILTGAPNLFEYKGKGPLTKPIKVAYAREGAVLYDGHQPGLVLTTLKRTKIRGVESFSMVCSEKELGLSEEHEGILILEDDAVTGKPLAEHMGDAVLEVGILPNMIRNACVAGVARELSAVTGKPLHMPKQSIKALGKSIQSAVSIKITEPVLNPRFVVGLVREVKIQPSPMLIQRRLRLAGIRPINSIVDATNYAMLELGEPLHAFDYDVLVKRAGRKAPQIITRPAKQGEKLKTLDGVERTLSDFTILVCDQKGALSLAGVMGGEESEVTDATTNVLLEGASWNFINIRRTTSALKLNSEASYRFARDLHPALAMEGVKLGLLRIAEWGGGEIAEGIVDEYPQHYTDPTVRVTPADVERKLGIMLNAKEIAELLKKLEFTCKVEKDAALATAPPHRTDIGEGLIGLADVMEEIARLYGYDNLPSTRLAEELPPAHPQPDVELEEQIKDIMALLGLTEVISYRLTSTEREARLNAPGRENIEPEYVRLQNPLTPERNVMRRSLLSSVLESLEKDARLKDRLAMFELGQVFIPLESELLPREWRRLAFAMTGKRNVESWDSHSSEKMDFYDIKGVVEGMLDALHVPQVVFRPGGEAWLHPGKCAEVVIDGSAVGSFGELHPSVKERFDLPDSPVLVADFDLDMLLPIVPRNFSTHPVPSFPPMNEDIAVVVDEGVTHEQLEEIIRQTGGKMLSSVTLFDIFRGEQIGAGKKSMAFSLTYQALDHTMTDSEAALLRNRIIKRLEQELGAKLRS